MKVITLSGLPHRLGAEAPAVGGNCASMAGTEVTINGKTYCVQAAFMFGPRDGSGCAAAGLTKAHRPGDAEADFFYCAPQEVAEAWEAEEPATGMNKYAKLALWTAGAIVGVTLIGMALSGKVRQRRRRRSH